MYVLVPMPWLFFGQADSTSSVYGGSSLASGCALCLTLGGHAHLLCLLLLLLCLHVLLLLLLSHQML